MKVEKLSAERLATFIGKTVATRTIQAILSEAGITSAEGGYPLKESVSAIISHFKQRADKTSVERSQAMARKEAADAETAEIKAATARNELMLRADCMAIWRDGLIKTIQAIKSASYIPPQQRDRLVKSLREIEVDEPE